eukprot:CAMPEP_0119098268 /NCGR_PEP_ID=MMETSP1178-20130426/184504_1 /TAXON_ID=33656 /ORGANISM="unid sp, Strain CCMP2000" /LENGTH=303 /DNA_ID=CAMNT_0007082243 /DNA_START=47 /DNA_END=956 /DNA_ORIENTATION=+
MGVRRPVDGGADGGGSAGGGGGGRALGVGVQLSVAWSDSTNVFGLVGLLVSILAHRHHSDEPSGSHQRSIMLSAERRAHAAASEAHPPRWPPASIALPPSTSAGSIPERGPRDDAIRVRVELRHQLLHEALHGGLPRLRVVLAPTHQILAHVRLDRRPRQPPAAILVHFLERLGRLQVPLLMGGEHLVHHGRQVDLRRVPEVAQRIDAGELVGPQLGKLVHVLVELHTVAKAWMVLADLGEELVRGEGEARNHVAAPWLGEHRLVRLLQRNQPSHQIVHMDHRQPHVRIDRAHVRAPGRQAVL